MTWSPPGLSNYNISPPPDDGSKVTSNRISWATIKTKLTDPLKTWIDAINASLVTQISLVNTPIGSILIHGSISNPNAAVWLDMHNATTPGTARAISRTDYAALFSILGTAWGVGDGSTTFNIPPSGFHLASAAPGKTFNSTNMIVGAALAANVGSHTHTITDPKHAHDYFHVRNGAGGTFGSGSLDQSQETFATDVKATGITVNSTGGTLTPATHCYGFFIRYA